MERLTTKRILAISAVAIGVVGAASSARAADDVTMKVEARPDSAAAGRVQFNVSGGPNRYDHADATQISVPMALRAEMTADADDRKIVTSVLFLKSSDKSKVTAFDDNEPQTDLTLEKTFTLPIDGKSKVAQDAIAACNVQFPGGARGNAAAVASVRVPIVWRVTTGKFNYRWTNYDIVAPSEDFRKNPDFYAERKSFDQEKAFDIKVGCAPLSAPPPVARVPEPPTTATPVVTAPTATPPAATLPATTPPAVAPAAMPVTVAAPPPPPLPSPAAPVKPAVASPAAAPKSDMLPVKPAISEPIAVAPPAPPEKENGEAKPAVITPADAASVAYTASPKRPVCNGGMVRQIHSGPDAFLCLCPGNTVRVETADNAFTCQRKR